MTILNLVFGVLAVIVAFWTVAAIFDGVKWAAINFITNIAERRRARSVYGKPIRRRIGR